MLINIDLDALILVWNLKAILCVKGMRCHFQFDGAWIVDFLSAYRIVDRCLEYLWYSIALITKHNFAVALNRREKYIAHANQ